MSRWELQDILDDVDEEMQRAKKAIRTFSNLVSTLSRDMSTERFRAFIDADEQVEKRLSTVMAFASLRQAADVKDHEAAVILNRIQDLHLQHHAISIKVRSWLQGKDGDLDDKNAKRLFRSIPEHTYTLSRTRSSAKHSLPEGEERIAAQKDSDFLSTITDMRRLVTNEFRYFFKPEGYRRGRTITNTEELMSHVHSPEPEKRRAAFDCLLSKHKEHLDPLYTAYKGVVKDWAATARTRRFARPISMRNFNNNVSDKAIDTLLDTCTSHRTVFHRYFRFKAKELGVKKLSRYDIHAPLSDKEEKIPFRRAKDIVLNTFKGISQDFHDKAKTILDKGHIDVFPRENKRGGGFCLNVSPDVTPYILMNYTGTHTDVMTLAHELGHAVHALYASSLPASVQDAPLPLAETASTFCELAVFEALYEQEPALRKQLLAQRMAESYATIAVQCYFTLFEIQAHDKIPRGMTAEELSSIYQSLQEELLGDAVTNEEIFRYGWSYIPHFIEAPFYCYAYCFGELLSMALYERFRNEGASFIPTLERVLCAGGAYDPAKVLRNAGFDMHKAASWEQSFRLIERWQRLLERL